MITGDRGPDRSNAATARLFGAGSLEAAFGEGFQTVTPWRRAPQRKHEPLFDREAVARVLQGPVRLVELDPRELTCTQPWVLRHHVRYYLGDEWERTGRTSADMDRISNRFPLVWITAAGVRVILAGHHRSMAALLEGRPVLARVARAAGALDEAFVVGDDAITPHLRIAPTRSGGPEPTAAPEVYPAAVADLILAGSTVTVADAHAADQVLELLGLSPAERRDRLAVAGHEL